MAEELIINSTTEQIKEFKESVLWADIERELDSWKEGFNMEMHSIVEDASTENPSTANVLMHIGDLNGRVKATDYFLSILDVFLQILEDQKDDSRHK